MTKQEIKDKLLEAVKHDPHLADIKSVALFGSHIHGAANEDSDVDVLMEFMPEATVGFLNLPRYSEALPTLLAERLNCSLLTPSVSTLGTKSFRKQKAYMKDDP